MKKWNIFKYDLKKLKIMVWFFFGFFRNFGPDYLLSLNNFYNCTSRMGKHFSRTYLLVERLIEVVVLFTSPVIWPPGLPLEGSPCQLLHLFTG